MRVPSGALLQSGVLVVPQFEHCWPSCGDVTVASAAVRHEVGVAGVVGAAGVAGVTRLAVDGTWMCSSVEESSCLTGVAVSEDAGAVRDDMTSYI